jgi:WD40-like Beta Propeller Repeat
VVADLPQAVDRPVSRCLRKELNRRAQHASDVKVALEELQEDSTSGLTQNVAAVPASQRTGALRPVAIAGGVVLLLATAAIALWPVPTAPAPTAFVPVPLTSLPGSEGAPTFSPDASQVAFMWSREGASTIDAADPVQVTKQGAFWVAASRDSDWVFYSEIVAPFRLHRVRPDGSGDSVVVAESTRAFTTTKGALWFVVNPKPEDPSVAVRALHFSDNTIRDVARLDFLPIPVGMSVSPDERYVLVTRPDLSGSDLLLVNDFR